MPNLFSNLSTGDLRHGKLEAIIPTISSTLAYMDGAMVACKGSPVPKEGNVVIFAQVTAVAQRPSAIRTPIRIFSDLERCRAKTSLIGRRERVRSMTI
jgi:hypothetical protein